MLKAIFAVALMTTAPPETDHQFVEPEADDVVSIDAVVKAYYASLSGEGGDRRAAKKRYASLFTRFAYVITPTGVDANGQGVVVARPIDDWMTRYPDSRATDFYEWEIVRRTDQYQHMASVFSTYEISDRKYDERPRLHGVTHFTLTYMDGRWWIAALQWSGREASQPLPEAFAGSR